MAITTPAPAARTSRGTQMWPRWRTIAIRTWAALLTAFTLMMAQGIVLIASAPTDERFMYATSSVWKLLSLGAVAVVMWTGGRSVAAYWAIAVGQLTWLVAGLIEPQPDANGVVVGMVNILIFYGPLVLLRPRRRELLRPDFRPDLVLLGTAAFGGVPLGLFAWQLRSQVSGELGFDMVGLYLALAVFSLLAALRPDGTPWLAVAVATAAVLVAVAACVRPHDQASAGAVGGALLLCWAAVLLIGTWIRRLGGGRGGQATRGLSGGHGEH